MDGEVYGEEPRSPPGASVPTVGEDDDVASIVLKESCMKLYLAEEKAKELSKQLGDVEVAQEAWAKGIVDIGKVYQDKGD